MLYKPPHGSPSRVVVAQVIEPRIVHMVGTAWTKVYQGNTRNVARTSPGHLLTNLEQFVSGHRPHGPLTADATPPARKATCSPWRVRVEWCLSGGSLLRSRRVNHFRCESHDRVTTLRRDRASAKPPRSRTPLVGYGVSRRSAVSRPTVHEHLHTGHAHEPLLELLVEWYVVSAHDDEQLGIRKRLRRERFEDLFLVARADAVCRRRIFQWFALSQVEAGLPSRWHQAHKICILTMQRCQRHATVRLAPGTTASRTTTFAPGGALAVSSRTATRMPRVLMHAG
jgi:hypothetical protein